MKTENYSLFLNPTVKKSFHNGPTVRATYQVIVCKNNEDKYAVECIDALDMEIDMLGKTITSNKEVSNVVDYFESMGVNLWTEAEKDLTEAITTSGSVEKFVFEQTGILLPGTLVATNPKTPNPVTELNYVNIIADLKQRFGDISYYNDKRKSFRRIKMQSRHNNQIQKYMRKKYPHIETYFNDGYPWSSGLCFKLPL